MGEFLSEFQKILNLVDIITFRILEPEPRAINMYLWTEIVSKHIN